MTGMAERALLAISVFVVLVGLVSALASLLSGLNARRREMSILRAVGARPVHIGGLLVLEAGLISFAGAVIGVLLVQGAFGLFAPMLAARWGVVLTGTGLGLTDGLTVLGVTGAGFFMGLLPAWLSYRRALIDGLNVKL